MAKDTAAFAKNDRIQHSVYGLGTISEVNERHTTIVFDENGTRKFLTPVVKLAKSATPAPTKPVRAKKKATVKATVKVTKATVKATKATKATK